MEEIICEGCGHKIGVNSLKKGSCVLCGTMDLPLKATKTHSSVSSSAGLEGRCGCGKPVRYMIKGTEGACNKYRRCSTYQELLDALAEANKEIRGLRKALEYIAEYEGATATGAQAEKALRETAA
ncbi:hypothetical protein KAR91_49480 [Candidatus Pacearchaeota archaeon]|nr:hypothetical protein [Candidatus Pacearchaeota archaeon]